MTPRPNAICIGGPCHGLLVRIDQDVGVLRIDHETLPDARYRVTADRVHHPSSSQPFVVLSWADDPADDVTDQHDRQPG
ncbi:hypothetical protein Aple_033530 [Acrocarpospora pleiomorpha]|uniref:Uncharacterized protein n=1 Tax=Acrocarpospora pleiomorpha TaxID=90975 RepID=A0A5M3XFS8_9ACTN|nr:hypothetical protein [Acrocarpospora pleiomorpha]GES20457.1 hypothetical protein Aple_033530 [Acrocarpospora pleiomorpha]